MWPLMAAIRAIIDLYRIAQVHCSDLAIDEDSMRIVTDGLTVSSKNMDVFKQVSLRELHSKRRRDGYKPRTGLQPFGACWVLIHIVLS